MSQYLTFIIGLLSAAAEYDLFVGMLGLLFVAACFRLVWGLCAPLRFSGGAQQ